MVIMPANSPPIRILSVTLYAKWSVNISVMNERS